MGRRDGDGRKVKGTEIQLLLGVAYKQINMVKGETH